jgi:hypothetical protein
LQLRSLERKIDFEERAKRLEETPLLEAFKQAEEDRQRKAWTERNRLREDKQRADFEARTALKLRLAHIQPQMATFVAKVQAARQAEYDQAMGVFKEEMEKQRQIKQAQQELADRARQERERIEAERVALENAGLSIRLF